jgi:hypothetical protein
LVQERPYAKHLVANERSAFALDDFEDAAVQDAVLEDQRTQVVAQVPPLLTVLARSGRVALPLVGISGLERGRQLLEVHAQRIDQLLAPEHPRGQPGLANLDHEALDDRGREAAEPLRQRRGGRRGVGHRAGAACRS